MISRPAFLVGLLSISTSMLSCGSSSPGGGSDGGGGGGGVCGDLTSYTASSSTQYSFATDILPIIQDTHNDGTTTGCATQLICHGTPPIMLNMSGPAQTLTFLDTPANVKAALLANSVNAPTMKRVVAGNVGQSFLAYKISAQAALSCSNLACVSGATVGTHKPCGDAMPTAGVGILSAADRTKILDWIAQGAKD
jgi:hypothetical protein